MVDATRTAAEPRCSKCGIELGSAYIYGTDGKMSCWACFPASPSATRIAQLEREYASLLETVTRKVNEKIEAERELAEARAAASALRDDAMRLDNDLCAMEARAETAEAERDEFERSLIAQGEATVAAQAQCVATEAERDRLAAEVETAATEAETKARDLRGDDATRRGYAFAATLIRNVLKQAGNPRNWGHSQAEAVRDHYKRGLETLACTFYKEDQHQDYARHILDTASRASLQTGEKQG